MTDAAADAARLLAENQALRHDCERLRAEAERLRANNHALRAQLAIAEAERDKLRRYADAVEQSRSWRAVQTLRGVVGRRW